jgi:hypothetical protein
MAPTPEEKWFKLGEADASEAYHHGVSHRDMDHALLETLAVRLQRLQNNVSVEEREAYEEGYAYSWSLTKPMIL